VYLSVLFRFFGWQIVTDFGGSSWPGKEVIQKFSRNARKGFAAKNPAEAF
jgi:hypothetical protein